MVNLNIKKLLLVVLALHVTALGLSWLSVAGFTTPFLVQIIPFIYLTFIPGLLILRIFRLHYIDYVTNILCSVGLSLTFIMSLGFFINWLYPLIGITKPISAVPLGVPLRLYI